MTVTTISVAAQKQDSAQLEEGEEETIFSSQTRSGGELRTLWWGTTQNSRNAELKIQFVGNV